MGGFNFNEKEKAALQEWVSALNPRARDQLVKKATALLEEFDGGKGNHALEKANDLLRTTKAAFNASPNEEAKKAIARMETAAGWAAVKGLGKIDGSQFVDDLKSVVEMASKKTADSGTDLLSFDSSRVSKAIAEYTGKPLESLENGGIKSLNPSVDIASKSGGISLA